MSLTQQQFLGKPWSGLNSYARMPCFIHSFTAIGSSANKRGQKISKSPKSFFLPNLNKRFVKQCTGPELLTFGKGDEGNSGCKTIPKMQSNTSLTTRILAGVLVAGLVLSTLLPFAGSFKNAFTDSGEILVNDKLSHVPAFTVTDSTGRPYLSESNDGRARLGYFFVQPSDAENYLKRVKNDNADAKILAIGMDEALKFLQVYSSSAKSVPERFELFPDSHEYELAQEFSQGRFRKMFGESGVPVFYMDGLAFRDDKSGNTTVPLFFEKERLDEAFENLKKNDPTSSLDQKDLQIADFLQTIKELRAGGNSQFTRVVYIPLSDSLKMLQEMNAK